MLISPVSTHGGNDDGGFDGNRNDEPIYNLGKYLGKDSEDDCMQYSAGDLGAGRENRQRKVNRSYKSRGKKMRFVEKSLRVMEYISWTAVAIIIQFVFGRGWAFPDGDSPTVCERDDGLNVKFSLPSRNASMCFLAVSAR